jgi:hypothetical protein
MPQLPYGGPITMPGGPGLPPGVQIGGGPAPLPQGPAFSGAGDTSVPVQGMPTNGMGGGKSAPMPGMSPPPAISGANNLIDPQTGQPIGQPGFGGPQMIGGAYGQPIYGGQPNPMPPSMYSQPQPNFANALGTQSPFLNSVQR